MSPFPKPPDGPIRLVVTDIDGCLTDGGKFPLDLNLCVRLRAWNAGSVDDPCIPPLVFCTARPLTYLIGLNQAVCTRLPSLAENGAILWDPVSRQHRLHPDAPPGTKEHARRLHEAADEYFEHDDEVFIEEGKIAQVTLCPWARFGVETIEPRVRAFAARFSDDVVVDRTHAVINLLPHGVNKGTGLLWLARELGIEPSAMAGIGDALSDWDFLQHCAVAAAPNDANEELLARPGVWKCASGPGQVVAEVMLAAMEHNRALRRSG